MSAGELVTELLVGVLILYLGYQIGWKHNIHLIHSYHCQNVSEKDVTPFTKEMGIGDLILGLGITFMPILNWAVGRNVGYYFMVTSLVIGSIVMVRAIIKYNGSLFGTGRKNNV